MRTQRNWVTGILMMAAIIAFSVLPVSGIAAELSVNEQILRTPKYGSVEDIEALLAKGGDVNAKEINGRTVLMEAATGGNLELVKFFIDRGLDVNAKDKYGQTVLNSACSFREQPQVVQYLKSRGAK